MDFEGITMMKKTTLRWCMMLLLALSLTQVAASCGQEKSGDDDVPAKADGAKPDDKSDKDKGSASKDDADKGDAVKPESPYPDLNFEMFEAKEAERFIKLAESELSPCEGAKESLHETLKKTAEQGRCGLAMRAAEFLFRSIKIEKLNDTDTLNALAEYTKALTTRHTFALGDRAVKGDPKAKVVLVEFADFLCSHCRQAAPIMDKITEKYGDQIAFYYKIYPLQQISVLPGVAAMAAHRQGKFWEMHDLLFEKQPVTDAKVVLELAKELGLNMEKFNDDMADQKLVQMIQVDQQDGEKAIIEGTPTLFINGYRHLEDKSFEGISAAIDEALGIKPAAKEDEAKDDATDGAKEGAAKDAPK